ncbi:MAG TPA: 4'-phosphopantetheinyl transferase superfamily protein [Pyrinomonadaceae bacterium]
MSTPHSFREAPPGGLLILDEETVHVWHARLDQFADQATRMWHLLSADEREWAERFHFPQDREHFITARALLRILLGRYLDVPPQQLSFSYSPYGKPALAGEGERDSLRFNVSHSDGVALYAVTRGREIGVDVERVRHDVVGESIAEHFFSAREVASLRALPTGLQPQAFFNCWTRKEAFIKAKGDGLSFPLDQFDVSLVPQEPPALLSIRNDPRKASRWALQSLPVGEGYIAALAVEGHGWQLECWTLRPQFCAESTV